MRRSVTTFGCVAAGVLGLAAGAHAGPFDPDFRGDPNSVYVQFDWVDTGEDWSVSAFSGVGKEYPLSDSGPSTDASVTDVSFIVPNFIDDLPLKLVRLQFWFFNDITSENIIDVITVPHDPFQASVIETGRGGGAANPDFFIYFIDLEIRPNPDWEEFLFTGSTGGNTLPGNFFRLEVDTISIPTPVTAAPLAFGALALTRRRR